MKKNRFPLAVPLVILLLVILVVIVALLGPSPGNIFSNTVSSLDRGSTTPQPTTMSAATLPSTGTPPATALPTMGKSPQPTEPPVEFLPPTRTPEKTGADEPTGTAARPTAMPAATQQATSALLATAFPTMGKSPQPTESLVELLSPTSTSSAAEYPTREGTLRPTEPPTEFMPATGTPPATALPTMGIFSQPTESPEFLFPTDTPDRSGADEPTETAAAVAIEITSTQSALENTATAVPIEVAALPLKIISASGVVIGDGTLRVFAPQSVEYPQTTRVELELRFNNRYVTPTPFGQITPIAVTQVTSTPRPGQPTPTERVPIHETTGLEIYQRMGASLICLPTSFDGCDEQPDPTNARIIPFSGTTWTWIISPKQDIKGPQDLHLELWTVGKVEGGPEQADVAWSYDFQIKANTGQENNILPLAVIGGVALGITLLASGFLFLRQRVPAQAGRASHPRKRPTVFISYRRTVSWSIARTLHDSLTARGADVFIDVDDINEGRFEEIIKLNIRNREYFVLVLAPGSLDSEWVIKEAQYALELDKKIIPVLADGFNLYEHELPNELKGIKSHNALTLTPEFFNAAIDRLAQFVGLAND